MDDIKKEKLNRRITEIDLIRGIAVILMMLDHAMYDLYYNMGAIFSDYPTRYQFTMDLRRIAKLYWQWDVRVAIRYVILFVFLALVGISCSFSKNNFKRGLILFFVAILLTVGTYIFGVMSDIIDVTIVFGILHCISISILLVALTQKITKNKFVYLIIGVLMVSIGAYIMFINPKMKDVWYGDDEIIMTVLKAIIGVYSVGSDCYSLLFFGGQVFLGAFLGMWLYKDKKSLLFKNGYKNNIVTFLGRHSLIVYIAHQVLFIIIFAIILLCFGYHLAI